MAPSAPSAPPPGTDYHRPSRATENVSECFSKHRDGRWREVGEKQYEGMCVCVLCLLAAASTALSLSLSRARGLGPIPRQDSFTLTYTLSLTHNLLCMVYTHTHTHIQTHSHSYTSLTHSHTLRTPHPIPQGAQPNLPLGRTYTHTHITGLGTSRRVCRLFSFPFARPVTWRGRGGGLPSLTQLTSAQNRMGGRCLDFFPSSSFFSILFFCANQPAFVFAFDIYICKHMLYVLPLEEEFFPRPIIFAHPLPSSFFCLQPPPVAFVSASAFLISCVVDLSEPFRSTTTAAAAAAAMVVCVGGC
ncbi:hypothetical protein LX32DRAFT_261014 [Colletotrichum zoysiae]|uniref:Uncharacterized protein n=1 Tax=Colletotrichum zoysiae TaxID=1216348 RepID=A0AAD9H3S7_9PEZI|nr:hypothetical protein LX32DRAFT_261014 [Colletotrichum zoysiae]